MSFSSGSCGNCYFIALEQDGRHAGGVIIDAGVSIRTLKKTLEANGYTLDSFSAVLVTHDHMDHIRNLGSYCKRLQKPVYVTDQLNSVLQHHFACRDYFSGYGHVMSPSDWTTIVPGCISAKYFIVPHDASQTVGYALWVGGHKFVITTDIGQMTPEAMAYASNADTVVVESNYDFDMLMNGSYPYELKMRVRGDHGHLCNDMCADAVRQFYHKGLRNIFLCHLSENNNTPELALKASSEALASLGFTHSYDKSAVFTRTTEDGEELVKLRALPRREPSTMFIL